MAGCNGGESKIEGQPDTFKATTVPGGAKIEGRLFTKKGVFKGLSIDLSGPGVAALRPETSTVRVATSPTPLETNVPAPAFTAINPGTLQCAIPDFELPAGTEDLFVTIQLGTGGAGAGSYALDVKVVPENDQSHAFTNKLSISTAGPGAQPASSAAPGNPLSQPIGNMYSSTTKQLEQISK